MPEYHLSSTPIIARRVDRRTARQKRIAAEYAAKREALRSQIYSVDERVGLGHYDKSPAPKPHGVEIYMRNCHKRDEQGWGYDQKFLTLAAAFPFDAGSKKLANLRPMHWEQSDTYYWAFAQRHQGIRLWCVCDVLDRLLDLSDWRVDAIPVRCRLGSAANKMIESATIRINHGRWSGDLPKLPAIPTSTSLNNARHNYTPYDYEWQTNRSDRDSAQKFWNKAIKN